MLASSSLKPPKVRWDLSALFQGIDDPAIDATWQEGHRRIDAFVDLYRGTIDSPDLTAAHLASALGEIEAIYSKLAKPMAFASLIFSTDTGDPKLGAFLQKQREKSTELSVKAMFFELELQQVSDEILAPLVSDSQLDKYRHYIKVARSMSPYRLSEAEEVILEELANTGCRAWDRLFDEVTSNHVYQYRAPGSDEVQELTQQEVIAKSQDADRDVRQAGANCLSEGLERLERVLTFTFNNLLQDKAVGDRLRKLEYPERSRHLSNELEKTTVDRVIRLCRENYGLVERYYHVKREILGIPELTHIDRYAPLFDTDEQVSWEEAQETVLGAFGAFSPKLRETAAEFFENNWIDAEPRKGKMGGAYCASIAPDTNPYVLQSFLNRPDDVMTLAHELGHGVHGSLSRKQNYFNYGSTLPMAELASTFGEMLVFDRLVEKASLKDRLALFADKVEGVFATVFRQAAMFRFEQRCHERRRSEGEMSADEIGEMWQEEMQAMFGTSVTMGEQHRRWWSYISHFIGSPFYVYAYSFGELLVLSLYQMAKEEGPSFADKYTALLEAGGSMSPHELMQIVDVDLDDETFWLGGFAAIDRLVSEVESLWAQYQDAAANGVQQ